MKKRKGSRKRRPVWHTIEMLKADEALALAQANDGVAANKAAQQRAAEGAAGLRECLIRIKEASKDGLTSVEGNLDGNGITWNALKGMGYRVYDVAFGIRMRIEWDPRPEGIAGAWWVFVRYFWRTPL